MKYDKIVLLLNGESGVGKTTIAKRLCEKRNYNYIKSYTTRSPRDENDDEHIYVENEVAVGMLMNEDVMASTVFGGYVYFTLAEQFKDDMVNVYVVDDLGVCDTINYMRDWEDTGYVVIRIKSNRDCNRKSRDYSFMKDDYFILYDNDGELEDVVDDIHKLVEDNI